MAVKLSSYSSSGTCAAGSTSKSAASFVPRSTVASRGVSSAGKSSPTIDRHQRVL